MAIIANFRGFPMRWLMLGVVGLAFTLSGCCSGENHEPQTESAPTAQECPTGECCSGISRAALLKQSTATEQDQQKPQ
jgi:hypothetical protein